MIFGTPLNSGVPGKPVSNYVDNVHLFLWDRIRVNTYVVLCIDEKK
jgi:hypothetical protein